MGLGQKGEAWSGENTQVDAVRVAREVHNEIAADMANPQLCGLRIPKISKTITAPSATPSKSICRPFAHGRILSPFSPGWSRIYGCKPGAT